MRKTRTRGRRVRRVTRRKGGDIKKTLGNAARAVGNCVRGLCPKPKEEIDPREKARLDRVAGEENRTRWAQIAHEQAERVRAFHLGQQLDPVRSPRSRHGAY